MSVPRTRSLLVAVVAFLVSVAAPQAPRADGRAPTFHVKSVTGATLDLDELRARGPVLLDFWATWCKPCIAAIPELEDLHRRLGPLGLTVVGISIDGPRNFSKVRPFITRVGITYPVALDQDGSLQQRYQVRVMPTALLIARDGTIARVHQGFRPGESAQLEAAIVAQLAADSAADSAAADSVPATP